MGVFFKRNRASFISCGFYGQGVILLIRFTGPWGPAIDALAGRPRSCINMLWL